MQLDVLAFGAHPDDIELTCSGTLIKLVSKGYQVGVQALTGGELGTQGSPGLRRKEFETASRIMGVASHGILGLPDGRICSSWAQKEQVIRKIRQHKPKIIFAPYWEDRHPDHANASTLVAEASFLAGLARIETGQEAHRPIRVLFYACRYEFKPSFIVDISAVHETKMEAVRAYRSQFESSEEGTETNISQPGFLRAIVTRDRQYGSYIGVDYGEPFLAREPLKLDDPVAHFDLSYQKSFV